MLSAVGFFRSIAGWGEMTAIAGNELRNPESPDGPWAEGLPWGDPGWFRDLEEVESRCRDYVEVLRWPEGVECPRCSSKETLRLVVRRRFCCRGCKYQFSQTAGTVMHNSHAPLWKWFLAVQLLVESDGGLPANQLVRQLGGSYKTAWFIEHRVRAAMATAQAASPVSLPAGLATSADGARIYDRAVVGCYHQQSLEYLDAYRAEHEWRRRHADNPNRFRDTVRALLAAEPLPYAELVQPKRLKGPIAVA
jgi:transposase-like protein